MSTPEAENYSQEYCESAERKWIEREDESSLPWLDEGEIVAREYSEDDPWIDEG